MKKKSMLKMKFSLIVMLLFVSCSKSEIYEPLYASYLGNGIKVSFTDLSGRDLLSDEVFVSNLSIYGILSKREIPFEIKKTKIDEVETSYLIFHAELPDIKYVSFNPDKTEGLGLSTIKIKTSGKSAKLMCNYKYYATKTETEADGNSSIRIESIEYNGKKVTRGNNPINSDFILNFRVEDDEITLK